MPDLKNDKLPNREYVINVGRRVIWFWCYNQHLISRTTERYGRNNHEWKRRKVYKEKKFENECSSTIPTTILRSSWGIK